MNLKELFGKLKKKRYRRILKLTLALLFLYFSYLTAKELINYYTFQKSRTEVRTENLTWQFNGREIGITAAYLEVKRPELELTLTAPKIRIDILESLKRWKIVFKDLNVSEVLLNIKKVESKKKQKERITIPPLEFERLRLNRLLLTFPKGKLLIGSVSFDGKQLFFEGAEGTVNGIHFSLSAFNGMKVDDTFRIPNLSIQTEKVRVDGSLSFSHGLDRLTFSGNIHSSFGILLVNAVKEGSLVTGKAWGNIKVNRVTVPVTSSFVLRLGESNVEVVRSELQSGSLSFVGGGVLTTKTVKFSGKLTGEEVEIKNLPVSVEYLEGNVEVNGNYKSLNVKWELSGKGVRTEFITFKKLSSKGRYFNGTVRGELKSGKIFADFTFHKKVLSANIELKDLKLNQLIPYHRAALKYKGWLPEITTSGNIKVSAINGTQEVEGTFRIKQFEFQGFKADGTAKLKGKGETFEFSGDLFSKAGKISFSGKVRGGKINIKTSGENVRIEAFSFLKKLGLEGQVQTEGRVYGNIRNPKANFSFSSRSTKFRGVELGNVIGRVTLKDFLLSIRGKGENIEIEKLNVSLKGIRQFFLKGKGKEVDLQDVYALLCSFNVKLPVKFSGKASGQFSIKAKDYKVPESFSADVFVSEGTVRFFVNSVNGTSKKVTGEIHYKGKSLDISLEGENEELKLKELTFKGGREKLNFKNEKLNITFTDIEPKTYQLEGKIAGELNLDFNSNRLKGKITTNLRKKTEVSSIFLKVNSFLLGSLERFTAKIRGSGRLKSPYLVKPISFTTNGIVEFPEGYGNVGINSNETDLKLILTNNGRFLVGTVRDIPLKFNNNKIKINMGFLNVNISKGNGEISIPAFTVTPEKFYRLYSVSGLYVKLKNWKPEVSDFSLSYIDGWVEIKKVKLNSKITWNLEASLGTKGLIYLLDFDRVIPYSKGNISVTGNFKYDDKITYTARIHTEKTELRVKYILSKITVNSLSVKLEDGNLSKIYLEAGIGSGTLLAEGEKGMTTISLSHIPVGQVPSWKGLFSGNLYFDYNSKTLKGELDVTKAKVSVVKENKKKSKEGKFQIPVNLNVKVNFLEPIEIKGKLFKFEILPELQLTTKNRLPKVEGNFYVTSGEINYMGKKFKVLYGSGIIEDLQKLKGKIEVVASSFISGYYVFMKITGNLKSPTILLSSDPPLSREQILNLIMTGASPEQVEASAEIFPAVQVAYYATATFFKPVESQFKEALKLESFSIEPYITRYGETVAKLTLSKKLLKRLRLLGYGTTGQNPEYGGSLEFLMTNRYKLELRYNSYYGLETGIGMEVRLK